MSTIGQRLKDERSHTGKSQEAFGLIGGVKKQTQLNYETGKRTPDADYLAAVAKLIDIQYVITGQRNSNYRPCGNLENTNIDKINTSNAHTCSHLENVNTDDYTCSHLENANINLKLPPGGNLENTNIDDFVLVPRYDVQASAGHGAMIHSEQIVDHLAFKREWVRKDLGLNPDKLALINAIGDSMEPAILSNDLLLVDLSNATLADDAIYVLSVNGSLLVKRIQRMLDGTVKVKSDNPIYENQTLKDEELSDLRVLGRVVWFGRYI